MVVVGSQLPALQPHLLTCLLSSLLFIPLLFTLMASTSASLVYSGQCREDQQSLLLQLRHDLNFDHSLSHKLARWNASRDCCEWPGITCDPGGFGLVIGLNLSWELISGGGGLDDSSALFNLRYLEDLDLSNNLFNTTIPSAFGNLTNLRYLDLSYAGFFGQIPIAISQLTRLISLNLSSQYDYPIVEAYVYLQPLKLEKPNLATLVQNLTHLTDLRLDYVDLSSQTNDWGQAFSSSSPNLQVLSMASCSLSGPFDPSLSKLHSLSVLQLEDNNFSSFVPDFFADFTSLKTLDMGSSGLIGTLPANLVQNLAQLEFLDLSYNNLIGPMPTHWERCQKLVKVRLLNNAFNGSIPPSLFFIPSLVEIDLSHNQLAGHLPQSPNVDLPVIEHLLLDNNRLEGPIPRSIFKLSSLKWLWLSNNRFSGNVKLSWIQELQNLTGLSLSVNNLTVDASGNNSSTLPIFPQLDTLELRACNLNIFPELGNQSMLFRVDLSGNNISGVLPRWILESTSTLRFLNLSHNKLVDFTVQPVSFPHLDFLDMHDNQLQGHFPIIIPSPPVRDLPVIPPPSFHYVDYSHNLLNDSISTIIFNNLAISFLSLSNNNLQGVIPTSICNINANLEVLDLSNNHLNGKIPSCLLKNMTSLSVLDLRGNNLSGDIPDTFQASCSLQTIGLSNNRLRGRVPKSLENCTTLEVLDLGNNKISDVFPCLQRINSTLRILILRNNLFHGSIWCPYDHLATWQQLQIVDLAFNNFSGPLNVKYLATWEAMMGGYGTESRDFVKFGDQSNLISYYQDSIIMTNKGHQLEYQKILTVFKYIDFSSNNFDGPIPEVVGKFKALQVLNFSHNAFTGQIPSAFGNLSNLESLDLSDNRLSGKIPTELASSTCLEVMNLSNNNLVGSIPTGPQLQTFENTSYEGNPGLCGRPLSKSCAPPPSPTEVVTVKHEKSSARINWDILSKAFGYVFGLAAIMLPAALWPSFRVWYWPKIDSLILWMFPKLYVKDWNNRLRQRRTQR